MSVEGRADGAQAVETTVTYLELRRPPDRAPVPPPRPDLRLVRAVRPTLSFYRYLYDTVGGPWLWTERRLMADEDLARILHDERVEVQVLWAGGVPAGYAELDRRDQPDLQLAYFGLVPEFIGGGLGRYLLDQAVALAWRRMPARVWVHTCDLDHPRALPLYRAAGFVPYAERVEHVRLPVS